MENQMSKIFEIIQELCPDGFKWKPLGDICVSLKKGTLKQGELISDGIYPVINAGRDWYGFYNSYNNEDNVFSIAARGEYAGFVSYISTRFWAGGLCYPYRSINEDVIKTKFIYYYLKNKEQSIMDTLVARGSIPAINKSDVDKILIPIPPLPIQEEIVRILDNFTKLEAELEAELEARKKQYDYYLNQLLTATEVDGKWHMNGKEVEWKTLGKIGQFTRGNGLQKKDFTESGVGCIHYGQIHTHYGTYTHTTISFISPELAKKLRLAKQGDLIIATTSEDVEGVCKAVAWLGEDKIAISGDAYLYRHCHNSKYIAYHFQTKAFLNHKIKHATGTKVVRVSGTNMEKFHIPIPPLSEQERIVSILDRFDALVNDMSIGLPAEIEARRKQYEYYRGKLLNFKIIAEAQET